MSRVIKAERARLIGPEGEDDIRLDGDWDGDAEERSDLQADSLRQAMEDSKSQREEEYKAAYDELIAAAQDEVALRLEDARREAQALLSEAQALAEKIHQEARDSGFAEGKAAAETELREIVSRAERETDAALARAEQELLRVAAETEPNMYRLALDIAEKILKYELDENHDAFMNILAGAMDRVRTEGPVQLHVNAQEFKRQFSGQEKAKLRTSEGMVSADITVDPSVEPGGCLIETDSGVVDASVGVQLGQIAQSLGFGN